MQTHHRSSRISRIPLLLLSLTLGAANAAPAYPEYRVTIVGPAGSQPTDMNQAGAVVGFTPTSDTTSRSFVNYGNGVRNLILPGTTSSLATAINDRGEVVGNYRTGAGQVRGYVYYRGSFRLPDPIPGRTTSFVDINNAGYILAHGRLPSGDGLLSYLRAPNGSYRNIGTLPFENAITNAEALNNRNQITGQSATFILPEIPYYAFIWTRGVMRQLDDFGYTPNYGYAINDRGQGAGTSSVPGLHNRVATLYSNGRLIDIDRSPPSADRYSNGRAINNHGHVVGDSNHLGSFIYRGRRMESLNALIDRRTGWNVSFPVAINDAGQIAARGVRNGVEYAVRLDLIRPHALGTPYIEAEDEAEVAADAGGETK
ncbi:HAF repeat-containing protein [Massilia consociata]|uniref:HAF repeat-containing protein n=1 Tax=Massilia consociata TaxID=760117 RepID=A0ABV6FIX4_9BURK